jgi:uncharacterized phage protein (TIGR01671 family)
MREILFRGLTEDGEWLFGDLVRNAFDGTSMTMVAGMARGGCYPIQVIPETVGQYTGLTDKEGTKIFEGDILDFDHNEWNSDNPFDDVSFRPELMQLDNMIGQWSYKGDVSDVGRYRKVIGNIHQHPDLLTPNTEKE